MVGLVSVGFLAVSGGVDTEAIGINHLSMYRPMRLMCSNPKCNHRLFICSLRLQCLTPQKGSTHRPHLKDLLLTLLRRMRYLIPLLLCPRLQLHAPHRLLLLHNYPFLWTPQAITFSGNWSTTSARITSLKTITYGRKWVTSSYTLSLMLTVFFRV